jgi:Flp pilus assembly pilin Flp
MHPSAPPPDSGSTARVCLTDEDGAQAVEYAMVGGLGAGLIGLLWTIISRTGLVDRVVETLLTAVVDLIGSWF